MTEYKIELSDEDIAKITALAQQRGVSASTIIQQAIATEKLISDNVSEKDDLLIKKGDTFQKITFGS
jgi:predicted transcriptional regulator